MIPPRIRLRRAIEADEDRFLHWRNLPAIAALGAQQRTVSADEHHAWFADTLAGDQRLLLVVEHDEPIGMLRYDATAAACEVSLYLLPPHPGRGLGSEAFFRSLPLLLAWRPGTTRLSARVLAGNERSLRFFERLGFRRVPGADVSIVPFELALSDVQHSRPQLGDGDVDAVAAVLRSRQWAQGPRVRALESAWCAATGTRAAVALGSGLAAVRLGLLALGVGAGDEVIVPGYGGVAVLNAILSLGATPVLADVAVPDWTLAPDSARRKLTARTRAIVAVHLFGMPASMQALSSLGVPILEDCAHGIGGRSDVGAFGAGGALSIASFYATKLLGVGEGGIVASADESLIARIVQAREYGDQPPDGRHLNDKMTDIEATLALRQLERLQAMLDARAERAERYDSLLAPLAADAMLELPRRAPGRIHYRYAARLQRHDAAETVARMAALGVRAEQPVWDLRATATWTSALPGAADAFDRVISLPLYPDLDDFEQNRVVSTLAHVLQTT